MRNDRSIVNDSARRQHSWRVIDDLSPDFPIGAFELDALEAFLMPVMKAILVGDPVTGQQNQAQTWISRRAKTHNRRKSAL